MIDLFFFEVGSAPPTHLWLCSLPFFLENTAPIQNLGGHRRACLRSLGFLGSLFPHRTELSGSVVLINRFQVPTQNNCGKRQPAEEFFKIRSHRSFAFERLDSTKRRQKLCVKLPKQCYICRRKIALLSCAHNCDGTNQSLLLPKEERHAVGTFLSRHVAAIKA